MCGANGDGIFFIEVWLNSLVNEIGQKKFTKDVYFISVFGNL